MKTPLIVTSLITLLGCADIYVEQPVISSETSWTTDFEKAKGQLQPVDNYLRTFTFEPKSTGHLYTTVCLPIEKRQVYIFGTKTEIRAVSDGVVKSVLTSRGKTTLILGHGDYHTVYLNLDEALFNKGDKVARGTKIGTVAVDNIENEFQFEIYKNRVKLNPMEWISRKL